VSKALVRAFLQALTGGGSAAHLAQILHGKQLGLIDIIGHLALELQGRAVVGLNVDDQRVVIQRDTFALVNRQMMVGMGFADREPFPHITLAVISDQRGHGHRLRIEVNDPLAASKWLLVKKI